MNMANHDIEQSTATLQKQKEEEVIEVNQKIISKKFMISMPNSPPDFDILTEILNPDFISEEMQHEAGKEYVGAIAYKITQHDHIISRFARNKAQISLSTNKSVSFMLNYIEKIKLKIIEPDSEGLRIGDRRDISLLLLSKIPKFLADYIRQRENNERFKDNKSKLEMEDDAIYFSFWHSLFKIDEEKRKRNIAQFISWYHEKEVEERKGDIF